MIKKSSSLREIRFTYTEEKRNSDKENLWLYLVIRRLSFYPTWVFLKIGISANQATFISMVLGVLGCALLGIGGYGNSIIGALFVSGWSILDCVDGNLARLTKSANKYGVLVDSLAGFMMSALLLTSVGIGVFNHPDLMANSLLQLVPTSLHVDKSLFLVLGAWGSLAAIFYSLISESFENMFSRPLFGDSTEKVGLSGKSSIILLIGSNMTGFGLLEPLLLIAAVSNSLSLLVVYYALVHSGAAVFTMTQAIRKGKNIGTSVDNKKGVHE